MRLQEFDLDIQHRTGQRSGNVDGLTRQCPQSTQPYGEEKVEELYVVEQGSDKEGVANKRDRPEDLLQSEIPENAEKKQALEEKIKLRNQMIENYGKSEKNLDK